MENGRCTDFISDDDCGTDRAINAMEETARNANAASFSIFIRTNNKTRWLRM